MTRRRAAGVIVGLLAILLFWTPSFVATAYTSDAEPIGFLQRPDKGWRFLYDVVRLSRHAKLGSEGPALETAKRIWRRADAVELVYLEGPVTVPAPTAGPVSPARFRIVRPLSRLTWFVRGRVSGAPGQIIGLLDYRSGRVLWDLRRVLPGAVV